jgi:cytochrome b561
LGVSIWLLAWVRLAVRSRQPMRDVQPQTARAQRLVAGAGHGVMYLMLVGLPMLGWALTNARGQPVHLPLIGALPAWPGRDLDLADTLEAWHSTAAWVFAAIVGLHATAALWHHRFKRDDVLVAMLPGLIHHGRSGSRIDSPDHQPGFPTGNPSRSFS